MILFKELGVDLTDQLSIMNKRFKSQHFLLSKISPNHTILFHGGGNFGDLYRRHTDMRNFIVQQFPDHKLIVLPQTINYRNKSLIKHDKRVFSLASDLTIMARSSDSYEFAKASFQSANTVFIPDVAFMIGDIKPLYRPYIDIIVLRRTDGEKRFKTNSWSSVLNEKVGNKYLFMVSL